MADISSDFSLSELQRYIAEVEIDRGFAEESSLQKCLLLGEEVGELFKAVRKSAGLSVDSSSKVGTVAEELADVLIFIVAIANRFNVDLESAVREKEERNRTRTWT